MKLNLNNVRLKMSAGKPEQFPKDALAQIAFSGRSNVGKSSLINALLSRRSFARVSSAPGKTITVNFYEVDGKAYFVDLPGYGYAKRSRAEQEAFAAVTDGYFTANRTIDRLKLVVQLVDVRTGPTADDVMMIQYLWDAGLPFLVVLTKCDKLSKTALAKQVEDIKNEYFSEVDIELLPFSSETGMGKETLLSRIYEAVATKN